MEAPKVPENLERKPLDVKKSDLRAYISKLNDRNLQRKRESGLTTYVLYSVLVLVLYKITEQYTRVPISKNFWSVLEILTYTVNIFLSVRFIFGIYRETLGHISSTRLIQASNLSYSLFEESIIYSTFLIPIILNSVILVYHFFYLDEVRIYFTLTTLIYLFLLVAIVFTNYSRKKDTNNPYTVFKGTGYIANDKGKDSLITYSLCICCIGISLYYIYGYSVLFSKLDVIIFGILFYSIPYFLMAIVELESGDSFTKSLENLEYEIYVNNLSDDDVRERLQSTYMGYLLSDWINFKKMN